MTKDKEKKTNTHTHTHMIRTKDEDANAAGQSIWSVNQKVRQAWRRARRNQNRPVSSATLPAQQMHIKLSGMWARLSLNCFKAGLPQSIDRLISWAAKRATFLSDHSSGVIVFWNEFTSQSVSKRKLTGQLISSSLLSQILS